ncbi:ABC transporter ATP-binding protein, partial [Streptomyces sp. NPDC059096]
APRAPPSWAGAPPPRPPRARAPAGARRPARAPPPTGALDSETGEAVLGLLRARCDAGAAGILVTHEPRFAAWADRVVFLRDGAVVDQTLRSDAESLLSGQAAEL